jgi:hypothetical protein
MDKEKWLLWVDMPAYFRNGKLWIRDDKEIIRDLDAIYSAARANDCALLVRPHPSQSTAIFEAWSQDKEKLSIAADVPLYPLLNAVDVVAVYSSTVSVEAVLMNKKVIQLKYFPEKTGIPLIEWGVVWPVYAPSELNTTVAHALENEGEWENMSTKIQQLMPKTKAAPQIVNHITQILEKPQHN